MSRDVYTVQLYSLGETRNPPPPHTQHWDSYTRALLVSKDRGHGEGHPAGTGGGGGGGGGEGWTYEFSEGANQNVCGPPCTSVYFCQ
jgi:hypothetical protein